nr:MAG TPA: hypothetical protein [Caudoviricetes sp.]
MLDVLSRNTILPFKNVVNSKLFFLGTFSIDFVFCRCYCMIRIK